MKNKTLTFIDSNSIFIRLLTEFIVTRFLLDSKISFWIETRLWLIKLLKMMHLRAKIYDINSTSNKLSNQFFFHQNIQKPYFLKTTFSFREKVDWFLTSRSRHNLIVSDRLNRIGSEKSTNFFARAGDPILCFREGPRSAPIFSRRPPIQSNLFKKSIWPVKTKFF